ncbi:hypothetical protein [Paenibacillus senegalensis]|uniref:hypothetical protein n=1 Tax=Paenibacillus senegalensis TaxID=1465766 RepID=UPI000288874D|nr:hypothetical protein [Paenibacillus senegalensis]
MTGTLNHHEQSYYDRVMSLLNQYGASARLREQAGSQLLEHMEEAKINGESFQDALGTPEEFAFEYLEQDDRAGFHSSPYSSKGAGDLAAPAAPALINHAFILFLCAGLLFVYYTVLQAISAMYMTTSLVIDNPEFTFNLWYRISDQPWFNLMLVGTNALIAAGLTAVTFWLIRILRNRSRRGGNGRPSR